MVHKETCPKCKGNRYIEVVKASGDSGHVKCPTCGGQGFKVRVSH